MSAMNELAIKYGYGSHRMNLTVRSVKNAAGRHANATTDQAPRIIKSVWLMKPATVMGKSKIQIMSTC